MFFPKNKITVGLLFLAFSFFQKSQAQDRLYMPLNLQTAYENGTRSMDGMPGHDYWQNRAAYTIEANLDVTNKILTGSETIAYENNSPDTLKAIRIKLQHDLYKIGAQRDWAMGTGNLTDGTKVSNIKVNGRALSEKEYAIGNTFLVLKIKSAPVLPKSKASISLDWEIKLPEEKGAPRECFCDSTTFFIPYWYPQVAVYDDLEGWATAPYSGLTEFYHEFADYDVKITVPSNTMVWATGELANPEQHFTTEVMKKYMLSKAKDDVVQIWTAEEMMKRGVFTRPRGTTRTFHYKAKSVPDFAFAGSDHYSWDATSAVVDKKTGRRAHVHACYNRDSKDYYEVAKIAKDGLELMSTWLPGYPYPYPALSVFNGDDGMEFPMILNDASTHPRSPMGLTVHESAHNYFPFMMGINEQKYAWMDEGWAAFMDYVISDSLSGGELGSLRGYSKNAGKDFDVPPMVVSYNMRRKSYRNASYVRPQVAYLGLMDLLGYEMFHKCMVEYMDTWKGKHPQPYDFFNTFNRVSGQNLNWYWKAWFFDWGYPDLGIANVEKDGRRQAITIENKGNIPVPVYAHITYTDGVKETIHKTSAVWKDGTKTIKLQGAEGKIIESVQLDKDSAPDARSADNYWPMR